MSLSLLDNEELLALAKLDIEKTDYGSALIKLKMVVSDGEPISESLLVMARLYATIQLFSQSQQFYQRFLEVVPDSVLAQFELGMTHYDIGELSPALSVLQGVLALNPSHAPALFYSALCLANMGDTSSAQTHLDTLLNTAAPDNTYFQRGRELSMNLASGSGPVRNQDAGVALAEFDESLIATDDSTKH